MHCRGLRGAITVDSNTAEDILESTGELLRALIAANNLEPDQVVSAIFSATPDLNAAFPARAARDLGWNDVALLCTHEMAVPGALQRVIRVLVHVTTPAPSEPPAHVYLKEARQLRPDR